MRDYELLPSSAAIDPTQYALASFLARYRGSTLRAYQQDLLAFLRWCAARNLEPLHAERPHLELYLRWMEQQELAPATIGRRFGTVAASSSTPCWTATYGTTRPPRSVDRT